MRKESGKLIIRNIVFSEIFLLVFAVFAFGFFLGGSNLVGAQEDPGPVNSRGDLYHLPKLIKQPSGTNLPTGSTDAGQIGAGAASLPTLAEDWAASSGGEAKEVFFEKVLYKDTLVKNVGGVDTAQLPNGVFVQWGGEKAGWTIKERTAPYTTSAFFGTISGGWAYLYEGLQFSLFIAGAIQLIGGIAGLDSSTTNSLTISAIAGIMSYKGLLSLGPQGFGKLGGDNFFIQNAGLIGVGVAIGVFLLTYKDTSTKKVTFECLPWEAPLGGENCELCNSNELQLCSEYRCKSLGQACDIVNKGTTEESCVWVSPNDVTAPTITPWDEPLTEGHKYANHDRLPPSLGAKIVREPNNCIQAFTPLQFGIFTNEPGQCKIDIAHSNGTGQDVFENMNYYFGDNFYRYNHTEQLSLPGPGALQNALNGTEFDFEAPEIPVDGIYNFYVRCRDANGNFNVQEFVFQICVDPSPDTTPPVIVDTSIESGSFVAFGSDSVDADFYINEPSQCNWDIESKSFEEMANNMECSDEIHEINAQQTYTCSSTLIGIKDREDNKFYVRCKDQPNNPDNERNVNTQSYEFVLKGSQPLNIIDAGPNETIFGSTSNVNVNLTVETSNGAEEGKAICYFSGTGEEGSYITMFNSNSFAHNQLLQLTEGDYTYYFRCVDAGGNSDESTTEFRVEVDTEAPQVTRAYRADGLKIVTNEDAECAYSLNSCNYVFNEGLKMIYSNQAIKNVHFAEWTSNMVYYIKCRDFYGNEPAPNQCSIVASASNVK